MEQLKIAMFGPLRVLRNGTALEGFRTHKVAALLTILAAEPGRKHRREALMAMLWPRMPASSARSNLRQVLYHLRRAIPDFESGAGVIPLVIANRHTIQLNPAAPIVIDTTAFAELQEFIRTHDHFDLSTCRDCHERLVAAVSMYRGPFLADFYLDDSTDYENWAESKRQSYRRKTLDFLETLAAIALRQQQFAEARAFAERQLEINDFHERAYQQLMEILARSGQRNEAVSLYEQFRRLLKEELGMLPAARTTQLYEKILEGDLRLDAPMVQRMRGYELKEEIGAGKYGVIYRAIQPPIGREVAVKIIRQQYANDPVFIRRFETEAQTIARLEHPHIVPLYDYWRDPEGAYLVMRLLQGGTLLEAIADGAWPLDRTRGLLEQIALALATAHAHGIVHRDIKPANILFDESGNAYLSDFGIAKNLVSKRQLPVDGDFVGTPDYISPEQLMEEQVSPQSDIYSLGAVMYEVLTGEKPFPDAPLATVIHSHLTAQFPRLQDSLPDIPPQVDDVIQQATAKRPSERYPDVLAFAEAFRQAAGGLVLDPVRIETNRHPASRPNPYMGLRAFETIDAAVFFGRESLTAQLVEHLTTSRFLAVVGPSGSGKSSVVKAGVIPALQQEAIPGSDTWFVAELTPGTHPMEELEQALWPIAVDPPPSLVEPMSRDSNGLLRTVRRILPNEDGAQLLIVIDQFEELWSLADENSRRVFLDGLLTAIRAPRSPVRVLVTLRADFYDRPLQYPPMAAFFKEHTALVLSMTREELIWAIQEPARRQGVVFEESVLAAIVADVQDQPGMLPLLQYALTLMFEKRQHNRITGKSFGDVGGVLGALTQTAEAIYHELTPAEQEIARQVFLRLIILGGTSGDSGISLDARRRVLRSELEDLNPSRSQPDASDQPSVVSTVLERFGAARLLTFDHDPRTRQPTVEVAHEALLREWKRLRAWLDGSRDDVRLHHSLMASKNDWEASGRDGGYLLHGTRLSQYELWAAETTLALTQAEQEFLTSSIEARQAQARAEAARRKRELETAHQLAQEQTQRAEEQLRAASRLRRLVAGLALVLLLAVGLGWLANDQRLTAQANFVDAERVRLASQAQNALDRGEGGEVPALLALRSLALGYSPEADAALVSALRRGFPRQQYMGHTAPIPVGDFTPDGLFLVTSSHDGTLRLWQTQTGEELRQYLGHNGPIWRNEISPDGRTLLSGGFDGTARLWDTKTGVELRRFSHDEVVVTVAFSPDGTHALTSSGRTLYQWNLATGEEVSRYQGHTDTVFAGDFSPDGRYVASASQDNTMHLWETDSSEQVRVFRGHTDWIGDVDFSPDGSYLLTSSADRTARLWDVETGLEVQQLVGHTDEVFTAEFSPDGRLIATGSRDKTARLWDPATGQELRQIRGHTGAVFARFSPDGNLLLTTSEDRTVRLWNVALSTEPKIIIQSAGGHSVHHTASAISPDERYVLMDEGEGMIRLWQTPTHELIGQIPLPADSANSLMFSPDGSMALAASNRGAYLIDLQSRQDTATLMGQEGIMWAGVFSSDGRLALTGGDDGVVRLWEVVSGREMRRYVGHAGPVRSVAFSPEGDQILSGGDDQTMILWQTDTGERIRRFESQDGAVLTVAFAPDGQAVASGHDDHQAILWDAAKGQVLQRFSGHTDQVSHVAFAPDGQYLLTGSADQTARLWGVDSGQLLHLFGGHGSTLLMANFSEDGQRVYTADSGNLYAWHTTLADLIDFTCAQLRRDFTDAERGFYHLDDRQPTCPESPELAAQVEPTWTPFAPGDIEATPPALAIQTGLPVTAANGTGSGRQYARMVNDIGDPNNISPIAGSQAQLVTDERGATLQVHTRGLTPGHAVTLWLVFFNYPENCSDGQCGPDDAFPPPGNTAAGASVMFGDGLVIGEDGRALFAAYAGVGGKADPWPVGLLEPRTAEIHFILRDHGPALPELVYEQVTTAGAGCNNFPPRAGDYTCVDVQAGFFRQPQP